jgi:surface-anchored protein
MEGGGSPAIIGLPPKMQHALMKLVGSFPLILIPVIAFLTTQARPECPSPTVLKQGHLPIEILYQDEEWSFFVDGTESGLGRFRPGEAVYHLTEINQFSIPDSPRFAFLGEPGDPVWIVSHVEMPGSILMGISGERIQQGLFAGNILNLRLIKVEGPGEFALYGIGSTGEVTVFHNSRGGITEEDVIPVVLGTHDHQNWAFTASGHYQLTFQASAILADNNQVVASPEVAFQFAVGNVDPAPRPALARLDHGDTDIAAVMEGDELVLEIFSEVLEQSFSPGCAVFVASPASRITVSEDPAFAFLGAPGAAVWILPQNEEEEILFLALAAEDIPSGLFQNDRVRMTLKEFEGPGDLFLYQTDAFGQPSFHFDTSDGLSEQDHRDLTAGEHYHMNWAFTAPGVYTLGLQASGVLASTGEPIASSITHFTFEVVGEEHLRLSISRKADGAVILSWDSQPLAIDQIQSRAAFGPGEWENFGPLIEGSESQPTAEAAVEPEQAARFFRVHRQFIGH